MNEILTRYKAGQFVECLELITSRKENGTELECLLLENCKLICESHVKFEGNDPNRIFEMQELHYLFFEKVISMGVNTDFIPLQMRLCATFNFIYWLLFYMDDELGPLEEDYLELINKGLLSVLGKGVISATSTDSAKNVLTNLMHLKKLLLIEEYKTALLILELVTVIIVYIVTLKNNLVKDCLKVVSSFVKDSKLVLSNEILQVTSLPFDVFKFSLCSSGTLLSDLNSNIIDYLHVLEPTFLFLLENFKESLKAVKKNMHSHVSNFQDYLVVLNSYELGHWNLCSKFITKITSSVIQDSLKTRIYLMEGKINSLGRRHKEALNQFECALSLPPDCPATYYYVGHEYGKMGLIESMVESFQKLVQVIQFGDNGNNFKRNFESILLDWIHPFNEISEAEAHYVLAVSYGLNESFQSAAESFEKIIAYLEGENLERKKRIIELPNYLTILHEASVMNLLVGNLVRAEQISLDATDRYVARKFPEIRDGPVTSLNKDIEWLEHVIQHELLENDLEPKELSNGVVYNEDLLFFFPENVIALLILSEIQRIQGIEDYKSTLNNVFSILSKYLAVMHKKENLKEDEEQALTLVKALTCKTCVKIANAQIIQAKDSDIEKMFKRALSCNKGDRDALYSYYKFLLSAGRNREALKLWNTFSKEKIAIPLDSLQSFSLRYLLTDKVSIRDLEKIQQEIDATVLQFAVENSCEELVKAVQRAAKGKKVQKSV